jgi:hypothetical protein
VIRYRICAGNVIVWPGPSATISSLAAVPSTPPDTAGDAAWPGTELAKVDDVWVIGVVGGLVAAEGEDDVPSPSVQAVSRSASAQTNATTRNVMPVGRRTCIARSFVGYLAWMTMLP